ncbi:hypothetical protein [Paenibacillus marinisediminis]
MFPKDIPLPKNAKVEGSITSTVDGASTVTITLEADMSIKDISQLYSDFLKDQGYKDTMSTVTDEMSFHSGSIDNHFLQVMTEKDADSGKSKLVISWIEESHKQ